MQFDMHNNVFAKIAKNTAAIASSTTTAGIIIDTQTPQDSVGPLLQRHTVQESVAEKTHNPQSNKENAGVDLTA